MKKSLIYLALLLGIIYTGFAQLPDSLSQQLKTYSTDSARIQFLFNISSYAFRSNPELNKVVLEKAMQLAKSAKLESEQADAKMKLGIYYLYKDKIDTSRVLFGQALEYALSIKDSTRIAILYSEIGVTYFYEENDEKALENYIASYRILEVQQDTMRLGEISNNIGTCYQYLNQHKSAVKFLRKAIEYKKLSGNVSRSASSIHNLAISLIELGELDSANQQFRKAERLRIQFNDLRGLAKTYISLSNLSKKRNQLDSALYYSSKAIAADRQMGDVVALSKDLISEAELRLELGQFSLAAIEAEEALQLTSHIEVQTTAMALLGKAYQQLGRFKEASTIQSKYIHLVDSLHIAQKASSLQNLQVQFDTERKDSEIAQLESDKQIQTLQAERDKQARLVLIIVAIALIIIVILFYLRSKSKAKANKLLDAKNQQLASLNNTKDRLFSIISHDLKSPLSSFHTITNSLTENWERLEKEQLKEFIESLRDSSANVSDMMDNLLKWALTQTNQLTYSPKEVKPKEVITHVQNQLSNTASLKRITIDTNYKSEAFIQTDQQFLEIIVRNLLSNALKFSEMESKVVVLIEENEKEIIINISDTGVGMDQSQIEKLLAGHIVAHDIQNSTEKGTGLGLSLSSELMRKMGARMNVRSEKAKGTTFTLLFPKVAA